MFISLEAGISCLFSCRIGVLKIIFSFSVFTFHLKRKVRND
ncbi:hypothetical protein SK578_0149 [Streptococcus mitis]|uniref:Uncharacterized protein n=1 Tax=Streptococcus mitis TaxID=28037 RepID=A0A081R0P6_STRMT|nr:hypothetical protein SK578_0149 [Streptococcus mitis]